MKKRWHSWLLSDNPGNVLTISGYLYQGVAEEDVVGLWEGDLVFVQGVEREE